MPTELLVMLGTGVLAGITMLWNIAGSPDSQYDEVVYTRAAQQVAASGQLTWSNTPLFVHPPLSFLAQAGWLRILGLGEAPLEHAIVGARVLTGIATVFAILLLGLVGSHLSPDAGRGHRLVLVAVITALAATDPLLVRYGRLAMIEPLALIAAMLTLALAIWLRAQRPLIYIPVVGLATGMTLLTKEVSAFLLFTPVVYHLLGRDWRRTGTALAGFLWGLGLWLIFPLWSLALGLSSLFVNTKFSMLQRLTGLVQITGWNRPGVSFAGGLIDALGQYASSYLVIFTGGLALLWLLLRSTTGASRWLEAWLITSYAFAAYMVVLGSLNEQFFVYLLPASIVGSVLVGDMVVARLVGALRTSGAKARGMVVGALVAMGAVLATTFGFGAVSWARFYLPDNDGMFKTAAYFRTRLPSCAVFTTTDAPDKFQHLLPDRTIGAFATGAGALSHGVLLFVISDKELLSGDVVPDLPEWVRSRGTLLATFHSATYRGLQLWQIRADPHDPLAGVDTVPDGFFVTTQGSRCGGYAVLDRSGATFASSWQALGGKAVLGPPVTGSFDSGGASHQVFDGAVLTTEGGQGVRAMPVVQRLAASRPDLYQKGQLPPLANGGAGGLTEAEVRARLTEPSIALAYLGAPVSGASADALARARSRFGDPEGPATRTADGGVRQAFGSGVFERPPSSSLARLAPIGRLAIEAGLVKPPVAASTPIAPPPLPVAVEPVPNEPTQVQPFITALLAGLAIYTGLPALAYEMAQLGRGRKRPDKRRPAP